MNENVSIKRTLLPRFWKTTTFCLFAPNEAFDDVSPKVIDTTAAALSKAARNLEASTGQQTTCVRNNADPEGRRSMPLAQPCFRAPASLKATRSTCASSDLRYG